MRSHDSWFYLELGGSTAQTCRQDAAGRFWFTPGVAISGSPPTALACPGVIRGERVLYASHLGWLDDADPKQELGIASIKIVVNDAVAAALGEAVLRSGDGAPGDLLYIGLGTGVGSAAVQDGAAYDFDIGHFPMGGDRYCDGCRGYGCLNTLLAARRLPNMLAEQDIEYVARQLATVLRAKLGVGDPRLIVLGGGIARRNPAIVKALSTSIDNPVALTSVPWEAKSAAYAGLAYLARQYDAKEQYADNV